MVGNCSTSKNSSERRWPSRPSFLVLMEATSTVTSTEDWANCSAMTSWPSTAWKVPRTLEMPAWRTTKSTSEWAASRFQVPVVMACMGCSF